MVRNRPFQLTIVQHCSTKSVFFNRDHFPIDVIFLVVLLLSGMIKYMTVSFEFTIKFFFFQVGLAQSCVTQQTALLM